MADKLRQAAEIALKAMQDIIYWYSERDENDEVLPPYNQTPEVLEAIQAVEALRQALTEPPATNAEPVAWISDSPTKGNEKQLHWTKAEAWKWSSNIMPLYAAPLKREWVGLTDEELPKGATHEFDRGVRWAEAKLKEKNT